MSLAEFPKAPVKVRILLDVDGVLNAVTRDPDPSQWGDWQTEVVRGFTITFSRSVGAALTRLAETPGVEIQWLTTWAEMANDHISPLVGIPICTVAGAPPWREVEWWKLVVARDLYEADSTPFVWIDDDLGSQSDDGASRWVQSLNGRALGIRPDTRKGLTPRLLSEVEQFVNAQLAEIPV